MCLSSSIHSIFLAVTKIATCTNSNLFAVLALLREQKNEQEKLDTTNASTASEQCVFQPGNGSR